MMELSKYIACICEGAAEQAVIELLLDSNKLIFRYNPKLQSFSLIEAKYLLSTPYESTDVYIFLDQHPESDCFFCRSFFPKEEKDYTKGQAVYTLLKKEKISRSTGTSITQYDRLSPKNKSDVTFPEGNMEAQKAE